MGTPFDEQLTLLRELQDIDTNLKRFNQQIADLPEKMRDVEQSYQSVKADLEGTRAKLVEVESTKKEDEANLAESTETLRTRESKLYAIKTNKEYQAAIKEVSDGKKLNRDREDRILQSMEEIESLTQKITQLEGEFADKESAYTEARGKIEAEEASLREHMAVDEKRRPELVTGIDKMILRKYDAVRRHYSDVLVPVCSGVCQGCSRRIPPQLHNEMLRRVDLKICPSCQRLLYVGEEPCVNEEADS